MALPGHGVAGAYAGLRVGARDEGSVVADAVAHAAAGAHVGGLARALAPVAEAMAVLAAIAALLPSFMLVAEHAEGRDRRYADGGFKVEGLPEPVLPALCASHAARAQG